MRYRPDLDGIRALAVLAVIAAHSTIGHFSGGYLGVDTFFVLSGYLITSLLLDERATAGSVSLRRFYARRALRLYPALLILIFLVLPFAHWLHGYGVWVRSAVTTGLYLQDFAVGFRWMDVTSFGHAWSLGVEEQFYLLWPPVLLWLLARQGNRVLLWTVAATVAGWTALWGTLAASSQDLPDGYFLPWSQFGQLLLGCCVAIYLGRRSSPTWLRHQATGWVLAAAALAVVWLAADAQRLDIAWQLPAIALITGAMLIHLMEPTGSLRRLLSARPLAYLGRRSYGIYLYHVPIILLLGPRLGAGQVGNLVIEAASAIAVAILSYRLVELPFLRLKHRRFEPPAHRPEPVPT